jgi:hypothetical protein
MLSGMRHTAVLVLGLVLVVVVSACGDTQPLQDIEATVEPKREATVGTEAQNTEENSEYVDYGAALSPVMSTMEQSLQVVEDTIFGIVTETTRHANGEVSDSHMRVLLADAAVSVTREGVLLEVIVEEIAGISPPSKAERYHELLLEYAGLRKNATKLFGEAYGGNLTVMVELADITVRADSKNKELVEEGLRIGYSQIR